MFFSNKISGIKIEKIKFETLKGQEMSGKGLESRKQNPQQVVE